MQNTRSNVEKFSIDRYTEEYILLSTPYRARERAFERVFLDERKRKKWNEVKKRRNKTLVQVDPSRKRKEKIGPLVVPTSATRVILTTPLPMQQGRGSGLVEGEGYEGDETSPSVWSANTVIA